MEILDFKNYYIKYNDGWDNEKNRGFQVYRKEDNTPIGYPHEHVCDAIEEVLQYTC